jgi:hypothetical protein
VALLEKDLANTRGNEAGAAGDEVVHGVLSWEKLEKAGKLGWEGLGKAGEGLESWAGRGWERELERTIR